MRAEASLLPRLQLLGWWTQSHAPGRSEGPCAGRMRSPAGGTSCSGGRSSDSRESLQRRSPAEMTPCPGLHLGTITWLQHTVHTALGALASFLGPYKAQEWPGVSRWLVPLVRVAAARAEDVHEQQKPWLA